jgi:hypothetical protein
VQTVLEQVVLPGAFWPCCSKKRQTSFLLFLPPLRLGPPQHAGFARRGEGLLPPASDIHVLARLVASNTRACAQELQHARLRLWPEGKNGTRGHHTRPVPQHALPQTLNPKPSTLKASASTCATLCLQKALPVIRRCYKTREPPDDR